MANTVDKVLIQYESTGLEELRKAQLKLALSYDGLAESIAKGDKAGAAFERKQIALSKTAISNAKATIQVAGANDRLASSGSKLETRLSKLQGFARDLRGMGGFLGNDTIMALGSFADGLSDIGGSIDTVANKGSKLSKILGVGGAVIGGVGLGASIYDATIGKIQGTDSSIILSQIGQLIKAGFNVETLRVNAQQAMILAQNSQYGYENKLQATSNTLVREGIFTPQEAGAMGGGLTIARLKEQEAKYKQILADLESGKMLEGPEMFLGKAQTRLKAIEDAISILESQMANSPLTKANIKGWQDVFTNANRIRGAGQNLLQAGQTFQQRQRGAGNNYQSALYAIEQDTQQRRVEIARNYSQTLLQLDQSYYSQRQQVAEQYGVETGRLEAEHQKNIRRMQEDHVGRLKKLVESRDALAVEDEIEQYSKERQRAEEDYAEMMGARQQDYARQLREMERAHQEQRAERQRAYQEQLRDLALQAQQKRQTEAAEYAVLLKDIVQAFVNARNEFAAAVTNNTTTTNKTANTTVNYKGGEQEFGDIKSAVYGAITEAFR